MESKPQNPEFRINPENFHPCPIYRSMCPYKLEYGMWLSPLVIKSCLYTDISIITYRYGSV